jgi:hypothetical protein
MTARELDQIHEKLADQARRFQVALALACLAGVAAAASAAVSSRLAVALALAAAVEAAIAGVTRHVRTERIARLALDADAYVIPAVAAYGQRCAGKRERDRTAAWIRSLVADGRRPDTLQLSDRIARYARDLERIASELAAATRVRPPAAVACRRLLTHAVESPLYNPRLPAEELVLALERIRRGILVG